MIQSSESIASLAKALSQAQGDFPTIAKQHVGVVKGQTSKGAYSYAYAYADLADTVSAVQPILKANGLAVSQFPGFDGEHHTLATRLMHESGEWLEDTMMLFLGKLDPQGHGSAITYAKRYAYCAALGIVADEDDDGSRASAGSGTGVRSRKPPSSATPIGAASRVRGSEQATFIMSALDRNKLKAYLARLSPPVTDEEAIVTWLSALNALSGRPEPLRHLSDLTAAEGHAIMAELDIN